MPAGLGPGTISLPIAITHGALPGPVLAVTAGIRGGEYVPMVAARQFVRGLDPAATRGTVVVPLQPSPVAFEQRRAARAAPTRPVVVQDSPIRPPAHAVLRAPARQQWQAYT